MYVRILQYLCIVSLTKRKNTMSDKELKKLEKSVVSGKISMMDAFWKVYMEGKDMGWAECEAGADL